MQATGMVAGLAIALSSTAACSRAPEAAVAVNDGSTINASEPADTAAAPTAPTTTAATVPVAAPSQASLDGTYRYAFDGGRNAGGDATVVTYTLVLTPTTCRFSAEGYQTDEDILCTATRTPERVDVAFKSYADGSTNDAYGNAVYSVGDSLFALERNGAQVFTRWKGYTLPDEKPHRPAVYFTR
jgi:hypothetical protein